MKEKMERAGYIYNMSKLFHSEEKYVDNNQSGFIQQYVQGNQGFVGCGKRNAIIYNREDTGQSQTDVNNLHILILCEHYWHHQTHTPLR